MALAYRENISTESRIRSPDRILKLEVIDGKKPKSVMGIIDSRLFQGDDNRIHIIMDLETSLWSIRYDKGSVPPALSGQYTGFKQAFDHTSKYFETRNVRITQVID